jgi:predicted O-methyltransferase YrrM
MLKNLVVQIYCSLEQFDKPDFAGLAKHDEVMELSTWTAREYAKRCGADYLLITEPVINFRHPTYERFRFWEEDKWWDEYQQILYLDTDVICWDKAPNIFEEFPGPEFKVARYIHWTAPETPDAVYDDGYFEGYTHKQLSDVFMNAGVLVITKESRDAMLPFLDYRNSPENVHDNMYLHKLLIDSNAPLVVMPPAWNYKNASKNKEAFFSHLWGHKKKKDPVNFLPIVQAREYMKEHNLKQLDELYMSWKNKTRPDTKWKMTGDMTGRLDWLVKTFSGLDSITEFGPYQGCSTAAWLKCLPKKLTTVDIGRALDEDLYAEIAKSIGVDFKYVIEDDLKVVIEETDLLFIDTMHTPDHTYLELTTHAHKAKRYLAFHDVNPTRFGTQEGIDRWHDEQPVRWNVVYHDIEDCGFLVLERP